MLIESRVVTPAQSGVQWSFSGYPYSAIDIPLASRIAALR